MFYQATRLNHVKSHQDFADKAMPALIITILGIDDAAQENLDTGTVLVLMTWLLCVMLMH